MNLLKKFSRYSSRPAVRDHRRRRISVVGVVVAGLVVSLSGSSHATSMIDDGFEGDFKPMWTRTGDVAVTTALSHGFDYSYVSFPTFNGSADTGVIIANLPSAPIGYASVWFYDDGLSGKEQFFQVRDGVGQRPGIGVVDRMSGNYVCSGVGQWDQFTSVARSVRWHEFRIEWALGVGGVHYTMRINGARVCSRTFATVPTTVNIGDSWGYVRTEGRGYWDDFSFGNQL